MGAMLGDNSYGKSRIRLFRVTRHGERHDVADLTVDTRAQQAERAGRPLALTPKEYALLEYLARNAGRVVSRADLTAHVWDDNHDPFSNAIEVNVNRLRKKVDALGPPLIHTRRGAGYQLAAPAGEPAADA